MFRESRDSCLRVAAAIRAVEQMTADPRTRREWLWLRAREKDDRQSLASLERTDPDLRRRMAPFVAEAQGSPLELHEAYGALCSELLIRRYGDPDDLPCPCESCARRPVNEG
jgi:hypothetical protein